MGVLPSRRGRRVPICRSGRRSTLCGSQPVGSVTSSEEIFVDLHAIEQTQLRRQHRVDGVGRPKFDFHTGSAIRRTATNLLERSEPYGSAFRPLILKRWTSSMRSCNVIRRLDYRRRTRCSGPTVGTRPALPSSSRWTASRLWSWRCGSVGGRRKGAVRRVSHSSVLHRGHVDGVEAVSTPPARHRRDGRETKATSTAGAGHSCALQSGHVGRLPLPALNNAHRSMHST